MDVKEFDALLREALGARRRLVLAGAAGLALGAAPMLLTLADLLATTASPVIERRGDLTEKVQVYAQLFDGSRFHRVVEVGGNFAEAVGADGPAGALGLAVLAALIGCLAPRDAGLPVRRFLALLSAGIALGMLAIPGAAIPVGGTSLKGALFERLFAPWAPPAAASLAYAAAYVALWSGVAWVLYRRRIFLKV